MITLYALACAAVVALLALTAVGKIRASERATKTMFAAFNLLIAGGVLALAPMLL